MSSKEKRTPYHFPKPGPYLARITNHLDTTYMGGLEVSLLKGGADDPQYQSQTFQVNYLSPFYGVTDTRYEGTSPKSPENWHDVQKSYGMWMVPPDVGSTVMVIFIDGDPNQGYWMGCALRDTFQNHMVPGIAASTNVNMSAADKLKYGVDYLPVAEIHKSSSKDKKDANTVGKPVHGFAEKLLAQGLLNDTIRGVTSSSARREVPSAVFGISTPGRLDPESPTRVEGYAVKRPVSTGRLGGHTFVMDDGDYNGDNQLIRLRTTAGHQILLHDSKNLIYIGNALGTAWLEMTAAGKIDIYAADSVSIHTEADFNFRAQNDINLDAGNNINIRSGGSFNTEVSGDYNLNVKQDGNLVFSDSYSHHTVGDMTFKTDSTYYLSAATKLNVISGGNSNFTAKKDTNFKSSGTHTVQAPKVANGGKVTESAVTGTVTDPASFVLRNLPATSVSAGWDSKNFYQSGTVASFMQRIPMHEPWVQHENIAPNLFTSSNLSANTRPISGAPDVVNPALPAANSDQPADWSTDCDFIAAVQLLATELKCDYIDLLAIMAFETGRSFSPAQPNKAGGAARGLIQFMPSTATRLGTTTAYLVTLTRTEQMKWVSKYFNQSKRLTLIPRPTLADLYMAVLWPRGIGQAPDYACYSYPSASYNANKGLDKNGDGTVTKDECTAKVTAQLDYVMQQVANGKCVV